jgi:regulator of cell morphogenesis and NO signaling
MADAAPIHDAAELTRHIEARYHARHREQLPILAKLAEMVEDIHFGDEGVPDGLFDLLSRMAGEMEAHRREQELVLFPAIRRGGGVGIETRIAAMRADHDDRDRDVAEIRRLTRDLALPKGVCSSWATLYAGLGEFVDDLTEHMRLENDVLFPRFERAA